MPFTLADLLLGFLLPLAVTGAICSASAFAGVSERYIGRLLVPLALLVGFSAGYYSLGLGPVIPRFDRDWLAVAAWLGLPVAALLACRKPRIEFASVVAVTCAAAVAALLVPTWESLLPSLTQFRLSLLVGLLVLFAASLFGALRADNVAARKAENERGYAAWIPTTHWLCVLMMFFVCIALMALSGSLGFATVAIAALGAGLGVLATCVTVRRNHAAQLALLAPVWIFLVSSLVFTAYVNSSTSIPLAAYVILPFAPSLSSTVLPRQGPTLRRHLLGALIVCGVVCLVALGLAISAQWESLTADPQY